MPHKRPKRAVRESKAKEQGVDNAPKAGAASADDAPKGALRVLNAASARAQFKEKKRKREEGGEEPAKRQEKAVKRRKTEEGKEKEELKLRPGESLADFNRRVDQALIPRIRSSKSSKSKAAAAADSATTSPAFPASNPSRKTDFDALPKPRRLNDVAQAPPSLTKLPRNAGKLGVGARTKAEGVVSMATKVALEEERERVVERYRMMKEARVQSKESEGP
ncbi:hypothetical protein CALCODRAFT_521093 [Calocera cornea HHB12733]|uniref:Uncharacterized protein n=1 Tax=Calocera cornea HHB12733 TaxID=1353952 RepID=A0A165D1J2_9BASI|nr:hypothetical protein CALCODRAFT_521093 [Calocera cornea HHB12733]